MESNAPPCTAGSVNLPTEIIIEILCRLPAKSLIRFRCVSKSWCSLIIDSNFIKKHLSQARNPANLNLKRAMVYSSSSIHKVWSFPLLSFPSHSIKDAVKLYPLGKRAGRIAFVEVCNGLFCIWMEGELFLWNPSLRQHKRLQSPVIDTPHEIGANSFVGVAVCAFGYDPHNDDYKLVRIIKFSGRGPVRTETKIYSLKSDSWRKIQECPYPFYAKSDGKFANGSIYWLIDSGEATNQASKIISFELSTETYGELPLPDDHPNGPEIHEFGLAVLRGMLSLYCNYITSHFVLWGMKDANGPQKCWEKMIGIQYQDVPLQPHSSRACYYIVPRYLFENGEVLLEAKEDDLKGVLGLYTEKSWGVETKISSGISYVREVHVYEETLVSPCLRNGA
ncbi:F-box/kelch-repeat protein At3g23880-like [Coffea arabica]|uniref:F-box/kelch-repeat protein At3g23880-like n=1 Tax=Coffea arabica TaxID=13443 RepID=A0ABM4WNG9_COFAR|nr:F-box/kelch-repeat protein At3g23880-like isoform X1 [Coffea arabica]